MTATHDVILTSREKARELEKNSEIQIIEYLNTVDKTKAQNIFFELSALTILNIYPLINDILFEKLFSKYDTHRSARVLSKFNREEVISRLDLISKVSSREIQEYLHYNENSAGFLMETVLLTAFKSDDVQSVLDKLRKLGDKRILNIYITDDNHKLIGRVPVNYIAIAPSTQQLEEILYSAPSVSALATREEVLNLIESYHLIQLPVVDANNHLLGVIRNESVITASREEVSGDLQTMFGAGKEEHALSKASFAVRKRLPWLQINLLTAFLASMVVGLFEDTIAQITILAIFLPVVAGQSGNTGSQALAVTIRGLALKEIRLAQWFLIARKELLVGLINGIAVAITTGIVVFFWSNSAGIGVVIGISMILSMVIAGFAGAVIPIALKAIGQDPATSSSIILTTVTDITGFLSFLGLATALSSVLGIA